MITLTRFGFREWGTAGGISLAIILACVGLIYNGKYIGISLGVIVLAIVLFVIFAAFFRNPLRKIPADPALIVSPADGVVRDIEIVEDFNFPPFNGKAKRIGIFLSVFNVHVNRAPAELTVEDKYYRQGEYHDARSPECAKRNEAMTISGVASVAGKTFPIAVRQISGAIARRIVCPVNPGKALKKGEVYGMIKFGSRTELYLPLDGLEINVKIGDRVYGGKTVMATVKE